MTQTATNIKKIEQKTRTPWVNIPQSEVDAYEEEIAQLHKTATGRGFIEGAISIYNTYFAKYGYTK